MDYFKIAKNFWASTNIKKATCTEISVFFFLLHQCNERYWENPFELQMKEIEDGLKLPRKTLTQIRDRLKRRGVIDFLTRSGSSPAVYRFPECKVTNFELFDLFATCGHGKKASQKGNTKGNAKGNTKGNAKGNAKGNTKGNANGDYTLLDKTIKQKTIKKEINKEKKEDEVVSFERYISECLSEEIWKEEVSKNLMLESPALLDGLLTEFRSHCIITGREVHDSPREFKSHFISWYKKEKKQQLTDGTPQRINPRPSRGGLAAKLPITPGCGIERRPGT